VANSITVKLVGGDQFVASAVNWMTRLRHEITLASRRRAALIASRTLSYYPYGPTGNLRKRIHVREVVGNQAEVQELVKSAAPHAHLYEWGSRQRRTKRGWNRGAMPEAKNGMVPIAVQERAALLRDVRTILASPEPPLGPGRPDVVSAPDFFGHRGRL
jgi:hypothetical protein